MLYLIYNNDVDGLKNLDIKSLNLNYLDSYNELNLDNKISPLVLASHLGRYDIVKMFLENPGIDVDYHTEEAGLTPLTAACYSGNYEIVYLLLTHGAEVNKPNGTNQTPIVCCFARLEEECSKL